MLNRYSVLWKYLLFFIIFILFTIGKVTENIFFRDLAYFLFFFSLTEKNVIKVISKDVKELSIFYIFIAIFSVILIYLLDSIGLFFITLIMIFLAIKITLQSHHEENEIEQEKFKWFLKKTFLVVALIITVMFVKKELLINITKEDVPMESKSIFQTKEEKTKYTNGTIEEKIIILRDMNLSKKQIYKTLENDMQFRELRKDGDQKVENILSSK